MGLVDKLKEYNKKRLIEKMHNDITVLRKISIDIELQLIAVSISSDAIKYFDDPCDEVQLAHINKWGALAISNIERPSERVMIEAIKKDINAFYCIKSPSAGACRAAIDIDPNCFIKIQHPGTELERYAVERDPYLIKHVENPHKDLQLIVVRKDVRLGKIFEYMTVETQNYLVAKNSSYLRYINNPFNDVVIKAVKKDKNNIQYVKDICPSLQLELLKIDNSGVE